MQVTKSLEEASSLFLTKKFDEYNDEYFEYKDPQGIKTYNIYIHAPRRGTTTLPGVLYNPSGTFQIFEVVNNETKLISTLSNQQSLKEAITMYKVIVKLGIFF